MTLRILNVIVSVADESGIFSIKKAVDKFNKLYPTFNDIFKATVYQRIYMMTQGNKQYLFNLGNGSFALRESLMDYLIDNDLIGEIQNRII